MFILNEGRNLKGAPPDHWEEKTEGAWKSSFALLIAQDEQVCGCQFSVLTPLRGLEPAHAYSLLSVFKFPVTLAPEIVPYLEEWIPHCFRGIVLYQH